MPAGNGRTSGCEGSGGSRNSNSSPHWHFTLSILIRLAPKLEFGMKVRTRSILVGRNSRPTATPAAKMRTSMKGETEYVGSMFIQAGTSGTESNFAVIVHRINAIDGMNSTSTRLIPLNRQSPPSRPQSMRKCQCEALPLTPIVSRDQNKFGLSWMGDFGRSLRKLSLGQIDVVSEKYARRNSLVRPRGQGRKTPTG